MGVVLALLGAVVGEVLRRVVRSGRFRRPGDEQPVRSLWWGPVAGAGAAYLVPRLLHHHPWPVTATALAAVLVLLLLALVDADVHRLPDVLTRPLAIGLALAAAVAGVVSRSSGPLLAALAAGAGLFAGFYLLAMIGSGLGYGDVKLAGAVGLGLGPLGVGPVVAMPVIGFVLGGVLAVGLLVTGRATRTSAVALGPSLAAGAVLALGFA